MEIEHVYKVMVNASNFGFYSSFRDAVSVFEELCSLYPGLVSLHRIVKESWFVGISMEVDMFDFQSFKLFLYHLIPHCSNDYGKVETDSNV